MNKPREFSRCACGTVIDVASGERCSDCTSAVYYETWSHRVSPEFRDFKALMFGALLLFISLPVFADPAISPEKLCQAIYKAEGGSATKHPYGILKKYKTTSPKQACINTVNSSLKRFKAQKSSKDFISYLGATYCPVGASNDPKGLNMNWIRNVRSIYGSL